MPLYALHCLDHRPEGLERRRAARPAHLAWIGDLGARVKLAGPMLAADGETPCGTLIVVEAASLADAEALAAADPYAAAGVFASQDVRPFNWIVNAPG